MWKLSLPEPGMLMYYFVKLIGLAPFTLKNNQFYPPTLLSILYSCFVALTTNSSLLMVFTAILKILERENIVGPLKFGVIIHHSTRVASNILTFLIPWLLYKNVLCIMNNLCAIGNEFKTLGIEEDLRKYFEHLLVKTAVANAIFGVLSIAIISIERVMSLAMVLEYIFEAWLNFNMVLIFGAMLVFIKKRFKLVNQILYDEYKPRENPPSLYNLRMFMMCGNPPEENQRRIQKLTNLQRIRKIELLHLELSELVEQTTDLFGIPLIFKCLQFVVELTVYCFWVCFHLRNPDDTGLVNSAGVLSNLFRVIVITFQLFIIAYASAETCKKGNATKTVLMEVWYDYKPRAMVDEFYMFALQMLHKPVTVSILGFFDLGYPLLSTMFSTTIAYVIIMVQFSESQPNSES